MNYIPNNPVPGLIMVEYLPPVDHLLALVWSCSFLSGLWIMFFVWTICQFPGLEFVSVFVNVKIKINTENN